MKIILFTISLFLCGNLLSQLSPTYNADIQKADSLFLEKNYKNALAAYKSVFEKNGDRGRVADRYKTAACWALLNNIDSAFGQLQRIAEKGKFDAYEIILHDNTFIILHDDVRWKPLLELVKKNAGIQ